jgi:hypothetical protein
MASAAYTGPDSNLQPNASDIKSFVTWWFERCSVGQIEIGWINAKSKKLNKFARFDIGDVDELVGVAVQQNLVPGQSLYVRAATVRYRAGNSFTTDDDFCQAPGIWGDIDTYEQFESAKSLQTMLRPNGIVVTGRSTDPPYLRVQNWFKCAEPIVSAELLRRLNCRLHSLWGGDATVVNPTRLMRLPGTLAWPWKRGRNEVELTYFRAPQDRANAYSLGMLQAQLPEIELDRMTSGSGYVPYHSEGSKSSFVPHPPAPGSFRGPGNTAGEVLARLRRGEGRWHSEMIRLVAHWNARGLSATEIHALCASFLDPANLEAETAEVQRAIDGAHAKWGRPQEMAVDCDGQVGQGAERNVFDLLTVPDLLALPPIQWLIDGLLTSDGFSVTYGLPGSLKTFLVLDQALHICTGRPWQGRAVQPGQVLYITGEGLRGIGPRIKAWCVHHEVDPASLAFRLLPVAVNLLDAAAVTKLIRTATQQDGGYALVVVDTVARSTAGMIENDVPDMTRFITTVDHIKAEVGCHLIGVHHSGKDESRGARGSSALWGGVDTMVKVKREGGLLTVMVEKQKDGEQPPPIQLSTQAVEWMEGLCPAKSIVLVRGSPVEPEDEMAMLLCQAAMLLGPNGRMTGNRLANALGIAGRRKQELVSRIPIGPDYVSVNITNESLTVRLARVRHGSHETSPVEVVRYDVL